MEAAAAPVIPSDEDLVVQHRYGDRGAFGEIFRRFQSMVYNLALRMTGSPADAEDLSQEVFLRIYRHLAKFRGQSTLKTWIYRVTLNHCRSSLGRATRSERAIDDAAVGAALADPRRTPEERAVASGEAARVVAALTRVPSPYREAVILRDLEELAYREIADVLGVRVGTVRSRIARGRDHLRRQLEATR